MLLLESVAARVVTWVVTREVAALAAWRGVPVGVRVALHVAVLEAARVLLPALFCTRLCLFRRAQRLRR